ncbi:MAG: dTDP-4-dehydrorhamnose reductase [Desulfobacterales bacterium]|nr:dTDP-4-dehydrorhamnose reductase [Desulfobacterales bacterium]
MKQILLVIGAKGMLGRDLMGILHSSFSNDEIIGWDIEEMDIQKEDESVAKIVKLRPEIVIHIAAYTDVDGCELDKEKAFAVNAEGTKHVALAASKCRAKMVYLSTDYVFDGEKGEPYLESDSPRPLNVYGHSKLKGEQYVQEWVKDSLIIRTQWLYGPFGKNFVASILQQAREKSALSIVNDQIGSPTYTADLAKAISGLIQFDARGIFHVTNSDLCTWYTFGKAILELSGVNRVRVLPISSKVLGRPAARPSYSVLNCQKLKKETGLTMRPWSEALKDYLSTYRQPLS